MTGILKDQVAIVTGASSGLGLQFARVLAAAGARVALAARRTEALAQEVERLSASGREALAVRLDVRDVDAIERAFDEVESRLGPLSILVNNAGVNGAGRALEVSRETFDETFEINVRGAFFAARAAARRMGANGEASRGRGRIVNISSIAASQALPGLSVYSATKAAVSALTRSLAREWAREMISVNALAPGNVTTPMVEDWFRSEGGRREMNRWPRRRMMRSEDLDGALLFLCGPQAASVTGTILTVDDGQSL